MHYRSPTPVRSFITLILFLGLAGAGLATPSAAQEATPLWPVQQEDGWGYLDREGDLAIEPRFDDAAFFSGGLARVMKGDTVRFIDATGAAVFETDTLWVGDFAQGLAPARYRDDEAWGYVDAEGEWVIEPRFTEAYPFSEGLAAVYTGSPERAAPEYGYIDREGEWVIEPRFWGARAFVDELAPVMEGGFVDGRWGYINRSGEWVIEARYDEALPFSEGLAAVSVGEFSDAEWGFIDPAGDTVIDLQYPLVQPFENGRAPVQDPFDDWYYIDRTGARAFEGTYTVAEAFHGPLARVADEGSMGYGHQGGTMDFFAGDLEWRFIDGDGRQVWPAPAPEPVAGAEITEETVAGLFPATVLGGWEGQGIRESRAVPQAREQVYRGDEAEVTLIIAHLPEMMRRMMESEMLGRAERDPDINQETYEGFQAVEGPAGDAHQMFVLAGELLVAARGEIPVDGLRQALKAVDWDRVRTLTGGG